MTAQQIVVAILLAVGVAVELLSCIGMLVMEDVLDRLHYLAPATTIGSAFITTAVLVQEGLTTSGLYTLMVFFMLLLSSPVLAHATGRIARSRRDEGQWTAQPDEDVEEL
jgi:multicomponent Na+:H+ antiporter subunit G